MHEEIRSTEDIKVPESKVSAAEINMAMKLLTSLVASLIFQNIKTLTPKPC